MSESNIMTKVQFASQTSAFETEGTSYTEISKVQSCNINGENGNIYSRGLGEGLNASTTHYGPYNVSGDINFNVVDFAFLKHWIGPMTGAGTAGDKYTLTEYTSIGLTTSDLQPFSIEKSNDTEAAKSVQFAVGGIGTDFTLSGSIGSELNCAGNFVARHDGFRATGQAYTPVTTNAFVMINGTWKWGATPSALSGVRDFSISVTNQFDFETTRSLNSRFIGLIAPAPREYKATVGIIMSSSLSTTIINDYFGNVDSGVYTPEDGSNSISPASSLEFKVELMNGNRYAIINLDECAIDKISIPSEIGGGLVIMTF